MLHPVGSLSPRVYWKRRVAGLAVVLLIAVVPFLLLSGGGASEASNADPVKTATAPASTPQLELVPAQPLETSTAAPTTSPVGATSTPPAATSTPPAVTTQPPPASQPPPGPPVACTDEMLAVTAGAEQPQYSVQDKPMLLMMVKNVGAQPCVRDVGTTQQEWGLFDGDVRLWGSNDCLYEPGRKLQTLQPGQQVTLRVEWTGLTSDPECAEPRRRLAPGEYRLSARLGTAKDTDATLLLR
ncbi:MAG: hypothetical protein H0V67_12320 [Geodermatophilaceae bacterium]|nr:hypothetical protein [Geodermatophilaceae bacterium]